MDIGFSPFATRPAQVESADDWLGEPRVSSLPLDGPVGTSAFPVQRRADDLLPPVEDSYSETRATLSPEAHGEAMGDAYGLFTEGLGGGPAGIGVEGGGADDGALTDGAVSEGDGGHAQGAPSGELSADTPRLEITVEEDTIDDDDAAGGPPSGNGDESLPEAPDDVVDIMDASADHSFSEARTTLGDDESLVSTGSAGSLDTPGVVDADEVADVMDAPPEVDEGRATIDEDDRGDMDGFEAPSFDGVADVMDAPPEVDEGRATIDEDDRGDMDGFEAPSLDGVADVMDAPPEVDERRATISDEGPGAVDGFDAPEAVGVADVMDAPAAFEEPRATIPEDDLDDADGFEAPSLDGVADVMDAPPEVDEGRATISEEPPAAVDDDGDSFDARSMDGVADVIDAPPAFGESRATISDEPRAAEAHVDADSFDAPGMDSVADVMDAPVEFDERRATISAVQAKSSGMVGSESDIQSLAAEGVQGSGGPLPYLDKIQASFGPHDVRDTKSHIGGKAGTAARAIGAGAYATGNNVAFAESPDVFTAAHEAAHVVQQRAGVQLLGGVGEVGDVYEQNADAVADAVVRGESASHLLGTVGGGSVQRASGSAAVQKRAASDSTHGTERTGAGTSAPTVAGSAAYHIDEARDLALKGFRLFGQLNQVVASYWSAANSLSYGRTSSAVGKLSRLAGRLHRSASRAQMLALSDPLLPPEKQAEQAGVLALIDSLEQSVDSIPGAIGSQLGLNKFGGGIAATGPRGIWRAARSILPAVHVGRNIATLVKGERNVDGLQPARKNKIAAAYEGLGSAAEKLFVKKALQQLGPNLWQQVEGIRAGDHKTLATHAAVAADMGSGAPPKTVAGIFARLDEAKAAFLKPDYTQCSTLLRQVQTALAAIANEARFSGIKGDVGGDRVLFDYAMGTPQLIGLLLQYVASRAGGPGRSGPWDAVAMKIKATARQPLEVLAGEVQHKDASDLTAVKDATKTSAMVAGGLLAAPVGLAAVLQGPVVVAEIAMVAGEIGPAWGAVIVFIGRDAEFALAVSEIVVGLGLEVIDDGPAEFLRSLMTKEGVAMLLMDLLGAHAHRVTGRGTGNAPTKGPVGSTVDDVHGALRKFGEAKRKVKHAYDRLKNRVGRGPRSELVTNEGVVVRPGDAEPDVGGGSTHESRSVGHEGSRRQNWGTRITPGKKKKIKTTAGKKGKWNNQLNNPEPDAEYELKKSGYKFVTDGEGNTVEVIAPDLKLRRKGENSDDYRNKHQQVTAGGSDRLPHDEGGHGIGTQFRGPGEAVNLFAQAKKVNHDKWLPMETEWADAIRQGKKVKVRIVATYTKGNERPTSFVVRYKIGRREPMKVEIKNDKKG